LRKSSTRHQYSKRSSDALKTAVTTWLADDGNRWELRTWRR
jgi:hypothetical protein